MAITKILYRNGGLRQAIDYITNPVKTDENLLTDYVRCDPGYAAQQMMATKRALGKTAGRQCYHIIQSFQPDEITPELAHEIAKQFAAEHLPGYEAVIATHVDKVHIHSHIVFNSVNAVTGKMYHSTRENYYKQIRGISDRLWLRREGRFSSGFDLLQIAQNGLLDTFFREIRISAFRTHEMFLPT